MAQQSLGVLRREGAVAQWWEPGPLKRSIFFLTTLPWRDAVFLPHVLRSGLGGFKLSPHFMEKGSKARKERGSGRSILAPRFTSGSPPRSLLYTDSFENAFSQPSSADSEESRPCAGERLSRPVLVPSAVFSGKDSSVPVEEPKESVLHAHGDHRHRNSA